MGWVLRRIMVIRNRGTRVELAVGFRLGGVRMTVHFSICVTLNLWGMAVYERGMGNGRRCFYTVVSEQMY